MFSDSRRIPAEGDWQMRVNLRPMKKKDMALIRKLTVETGWNSLSKMDQKELDKKEWSKHMEEVFEHFAKQENSEIYIAEDENNKFLGYLFVGESKNNMTGNSSGFIYDIFVKEELRGKGIGKKLIEKAESYCRQRGYSRLSLMVSAHNQPALKLYASTGFKKDQIYMDKEIG
jgi:ribosomal protein S18 acetylase RimI-like enzyme